MGKPVENPQRTPRSLTYKRRALVGKLWVRGYSEREIAELVRMEAANPASQLHGCEKTTHVTVHYDVVEGRKQWLEQINGPTDAMRSEQVASLMDIRHQAWADFARVPITNTFARATLLRIALEADEKLAKITGTLSPTKITDGEGGPLLAPIVELHMPDGTVVKPPRNGHDNVEALEATTLDHGNNGSKQTES